MTNPAARFPTPQDAETAFYEALEHAQIDALMATWAEDEDVVCNHPEGPRLSGYSAVRDGWQRFFTETRPRRLDLSTTHRWDAMMLAAHHGVEIWHVAGESAPRPPIFVTHVFLRTPLGWRMVARHTSPAPLEELTRDTPEGRRLH